MSILQPKMTDSFLKVGIHMMGVSKTQTSKTQTSDPKKLRPLKNSDPLGVSKTQTQKTQTLWVSRKLSGRRSQDRWRGEGGKRVEVAIDVITCGSGA